MTQAVRIESLLDTRSASFESPFSMLEACHERVARSLALLQRLRTHLQAQGVDDDARQAARDILRYFDIAAPAHHQDEELHVFPVLLARGPQAVHAAVQRLHQDHLRMHAAWQQARAVLQTLADGSGAVPDAHGGAVLTAGQEAVLDGFAGLYADHIRLEEDEVYPQARALLDGAAMAAMGHEMMRRRGAG